MVLHKKESARIYLSVPSRHHIRPASIPQRQVLPVARIGVMLELAVVGPALSPAGKVRAPGQGRRVVGRSVAVVLSENAVCVTSS
jgi:hypothetical protein